jgi:outer membrane protein assembly factor BamB
MKHLLLSLVIWALSTGAHANTYPMEAGDLRRHNQAMDLTIAALPLDVVWKSYICGGTPRSNPIVLEDRIIQAFQTGDVCVSRFDGKLIWGVGSVGDQWNPPAYDPDRDLLYQSGYNVGAVFALHASDGTEAWHYYEGGARACVNMGSPIYWQDKVYAGTATGRIVCLDANTHSVLWGLTLGAKTGMGTPALDGGQLFIGTLAGKIFCVDALTGAVAWQISSPRTCYASAVSLDNTRLFVMTSGGKVECRLRSNGSLVWSFQTASFTLSNLSQGPLGLYCTSDDRCIYRLNPATGAVLWQTCFVGNFARSAPFCAGDVVLASGCTGVFYGVDAASGTASWNLDHHGAESFTDFAEADGLIFVCNLYGVMYCLRPQNVSNPATVTVSPTLTISPSPTRTPSPTKSATPSPSFSATLTPSSSATSSATRTASPSATRSASPTVTATPSPSATVTGSPSFSPTSTITPDATSTLVSTIDIHGDEGKRDPGEGHCYVAPNPVHGGPCRLIYHMRAPGLCKVRLFQASGDPVGHVEEHHDSPGVHSCEISTQRYAPGVYFCQTNMAYDNGEEDKLPLAKFIVLTAR